MIEHSDPVEKGFNEPGSIYRKFGNYYDMIYDKFIDYNSDCDFLERIFSIHLDRSDSQTERDRLDILDIGCGTGNHAIELARRGYFVLGLDLSEYSIMVGRKKLDAEPELKGRVHFLKQDMRNICFKRRFDSAIALFGVISYLREKNELLAFFSRIKEILRPGGIFMGEIWQLSGVIPGFKSENTGKDEQGQIEITRFAESRSTDIHGLLEIEMNFQVMDIKACEVIDKFTEFHYLKAYDLDEFETHLISAGFEPLGFYNADPKKKDLKPVNKKSFRTFFISKLPV